MRGNRFWRRFLWIGLVINVAFLIYFMPMADWSDVDDVVRVCMRVLTVVFCIFTIRQFRESKESETR